MTVTPRLRTAAAVFLMFLAAACGGSKENPGDVPTLRRGISAKVDTLDPHKSSAKWENIVIGDMLIGLMTDGEDGRPQPGMAESYTTDASGLIWTFKLGEHAWSDGVPVTAEDFVYALRRIQLPETASQYASLLWIIKNAKEVNEGALPPAELGVRAIDAKTLEITLKEPAPYLLGLLTHYTTFPVPKHVVNSKGDAWIQPENIVVNGPYKLVYWRTGDQLVAEKNPTGFGADKACFSRVVYFEIEDQQAVENKIRAGELDVNNGFDGTRSKELDEKFPGWRRAHPALWTTYWVFNSSKKPFDDPRVRKALAMALDREFIIKSVLTPGFEPAYSFVPPGIDNYDTAHPAVAWQKMPRAERLKEAKALLEQAGFGPAKPLKFEYTHRSTDDNPKAAPIALSNWSDIAPWVQPTIVRQDTKVLYARLRNSDFQVSDAAWVADFDDPVNFLYLLQSETGQQNYGRYANAEYDALLAKANAEMDIKKRAAIFAEAEKVMLDEHPLTPMWFNVSKNLVDPTLTGWTGNAKDDHRSRFLCRAGMTPE